MQRPNAVYVWDPFVRIFHWSLVTCVLLNQFVLEEGETAHEWTGYVAAGWVAARLLWGFVGTRHARFADWWPTPTRLRRHVQALLRGKPDDHPGHNPLGAIAMLVLMGLILALAFTGWLQGTDAFFGEEWVEELHEGLANTLLVVAGLHAASALVMGRLQRVGLIRAMITGVKVYRRQ